MVGLPRCENYIFLATNQLFPSNFLATIRRNEKTAVVFTLRLRRKGVQMSGSSQVETLYFKTVIKSYYAVPETGKTWYNGQKRVSCEG